MMKLKSIQGPAMGCRATDDDDDDKQKYSQNDALFKN
jgi:hypothetical protein